MTRQPYAAVVCPVHGSVDLDAAQYEVQLAAPDAHWHCPCCGQPGYFDEERFSELHHEGYRETAVPQGA